jgi:hypothetical protein
LCIWFAKSLGNAGEREYLIVDADIHLLTSGGGRFGMRRVRGVCAWKHGKRGSEMGFVRLYKCFV